MTRSVCSRFQGVSEARYGSGISVSINRRKLCEWSPRGAILSGFAPSNERESEVTFAILMGRIASKSYACTCTKVPELAFPFGKSTRLTLT
ncbi:hypothetical protein B0H34DRAFT_279693 [Crassisporium funariophilum]|nr:hypothetical protein B0H34DRAFT_279693 [Crassisporium funariophilum]